MDKFWPHLIPGHFGNESCENVSIDVALKGCFDNYDTTACVRNTLLAFVGLVTLFFCIIRILRLHYVHHPQIHQYLVFYFASFEVLFLSLKWIALIQFYQLEFTASYLKLIQFILLCHFYWSLVSRILHKQRIINWVIVPLLCIFFCILTAVTVMGLLTHLSMWVECLAPHWLLLSIAEFGGIQLYIIAGVYITRKINAISAMSSFKWEQKRDLWSVIVTYAFSSFTSVVYYSTLQALGSFETGCSGIFGHMQEVYSPIYIGFMGPTLVDDSTNWYLVLLLLTLSLFAPPYASCESPGSYQIIKVIKYLLPIWVMLLVFYPTRGCMSSEEERLLGWSISGSTTSVFSPGAYKQMTLPVENGFPDDHSTMRRSASSPAFLSKPPLSPISEEAPTFPPSQVHYQSYGATDSYPSQTAAFIQPTTSRTRTRHNSGHPSMHRSSRHTRHNRVPVSLNHCPDEVESITSTSGERA